MKKTLKNKQFLLLIALCMASLLSLSTSFGFYADTSNGFAASPLIEQNAETTTESNEDSALSGEVAFAKAVIDIIRKGLSTRL